MELIFDTEASGKANFKSSYNDKQPWICQICMILSTSDTIYTKSTFLIQSDGRKISEGAYKTHGISTEECDKYGISELTACFLFLETLIAADKIVCHNVQFDRLLAAHMLYTNDFTDEAEYLMKHKNFCTMKESTDLCKIPGNYGNYKWPKLQELHNHLFGSDFSGAHGALADTEATRRCFYEIIKGE